MASFKELYKKVTQEMKRELLRHPPPTGQEAVIMEVFRKRAAEDYATLKKNRRRKRTSK